MKIGILGSGEVGKALGAAFASKGHDVKLGSRSPGKADLKEWLKATKGKAATATLSETAAHGEVLVLCTVGSAADEAIRLADERNFDGKVLIDVTNPLDTSKAGETGLFVGLTDSLGERIQRRLPKARVVKCFNIVPSATMVHPRRKEGLPDMIIAGIDSGAKRTVTSLLKEFGWGAPIDIGGIEGARWLEALVPLWVRVANAKGDWGIAFKVLGS